MNQSTLRRAQPLSPYWDFGCDSHSCSGRQVTLPAANREEDPKVTEIHGRKLVDNYFWMRDKQNPSEGYLERRTLYRRRDEADLPLQEKLYNEMLSRIKEDDAEVLTKTAIFLLHPHRGR